MKTEEKHNTPHVTVHVTGKHMHHAGTLCCTQCQYCTHVSQNQTSGCWSPLGGANWTGLTAVQVAAADSNDHEQDASPCSQAVVEAGMVCMVGLRRRAIECTGHARCIGSVMSMIDRPRLDRFKGKNIRRLLWMVCGKTRRLGHIRGPSWVRWRLGHKNLLDATRLWPCMQEDYQRVLEPILLNPAVLVGDMVRHDEMWADVLLEEGNDDNGLCCNETSESRLGLPSSWLWFIGALEHMQKNHNYSVLTSFRYVTVFLYQDTCGWGRRRLVREVVGR